MRLFLYRHGDHARQSEDHGVLPGIAAVDHRSGGYHRSRLGLAHADLMVVLIAVDLTWVVLAAQARRWLKSPRAMRIANRIERHRHGRCGDRDCDGMIETQRAIIVE